MQIKLTPSPWRIESTAMLWLAAPLVAANLLQMAVYAIDVIFVARLGQEQLAASSLSISLFGLMIWSFSGLTGAVAPLISAELGRRTHAVREVRRSVRMALWLSVAVGLAGMVVCGLGEHILLALGQNPKVATRAGAFLAVLKWAMIPMIACNVLRCFVSTLGRPVFATAITALAIVVNACGNYAFVFGHWGMPALGLPGSAWSSVITSLITLAAYAALIQSDRRLRRYRLAGRWWRAEWARLADLLRLGTPIALTVVADAGLFGSAAFLMGLIGEAELAGHTIALQVAAFTFQIPMGISQAATIRVGYHYGAGDQAGIARAGWTALAVGLGFSTASAAAMVLFPRFILSAYVDVTAPANAIMVALALRYLAFAAAFQLADGIQAIAAGALRGLQDTRIPMLVAIFGYWLPGFGTAAYLGLATPMRGSGVWIGLAVGLVVVSILLLSRWHRRDRLGLLPEEV